MLIVLNLVIILFVVGMAALWATYGFFSGFLQLIVVIASGVIALALWEPLAFWLLGRMPAYAHGVGLLAPFALSIILLRVPLDKFCKMNLHLPHLADQIGGGLCGFAAGILAFGMLLNGANYLPIERAAMGWEPLSIQGTELVENEEGQLWSFTRVNEWSGGFFEFLSAGAMSPTGGTPLAEVVPNFAVQAMEFRAPIDPNQNKVAHPDSVQVVGLYAVPATADGVAALMERAAIISFLAPGYKPPADVNYGESGMGLVNAIKRDLANRFDDAEKHGKPSELLNISKIMDANRELKLEIKAPASKAGFDQFLPAVTAKLTDTLLKNDQGAANGFAQALGEGKSLFVVDTLWNNNTPGAYDSDGNLRVDITQVRLQVKSANGESMVAPAAYSIEYNQNTNDRILTEVKSTTIYRAFSAYPEFHLGWAFVLPESDEPIRFYARKLRFNLTEMEPPEGEEASVNQNFGAVARILGTPALPGAKDDPDKPDNQTPQVQEFLGPTAIGTTGAFAEISERLPATYGGAGATSLEHDKDSEPWTLFSGKQDRVQKGRGGQKSSVREVQVGEGFRLVQIKLDSSQASSLYGQAIGLARNLNVMRVKDEGGNGYAGIGYVLDRGGDFLSIDIRGSGVAQGGVSASELPNFAQGETLYVYFQVPVDKKIVAYSLGSKDEYFEKPLTTVEKRRR